MCTVHVLAGLAGHIIVQVCIYGYNGQPADESLRVAYCIEMCSARELDGLAGEFT